MQKRWISLVSIAIIAIGIIAFNKFFLVPMEYQEAALDSAQNINLLPKEPQVLYGMVVDDFTVIEDKIKRNEVRNQFWEGTGATMRWS